MTQRGRPGRTPWNQSELELLKKLRARGCKTKEIALALPGRSIHSINDKIYEVDLRQVSGNLRLVMKGQRRSNLPTEEMLAEAEQRMSYEKTIETELMGDPPPGRSALDEKLRHE